ncbi:MAG TPA: hypothetical protein VIL71_14395 [Spirillospora sp.]
MSRFSRTRPATGRQRRFFLWVDAGRHLVTAAVSACVLGLGVADPDSVPRGFIPVLVAAAVAVLCSVLSTGAVLMMLRDRRPRTVLRTAFAVWCAGIAGTLLVTIAVIAAGDEAFPGVLMVLFALPFLIFTKPRPA